MSKQTTTSRKGHQGVNRLTPSCQRRWKKRRTKYLYDPFGSTLSISGPLASFNAYRFSSKEWNGNSGLYYYLYRLYDPNLQRWLNEDPIAENGGINLYNFSGNTPTWKIDALGLSGSPVGCPACICKKAKFGKVPTTLIAYGNYPGPGQGGIGFHILYEIETEGIKSQCHCKYVDNGSITGNGTYASGQPFNPKPQTYNNRPTTIPCENGTDTPGFQVQYPPNWGFSVTFTANYNWTGTVSCESEFGPSLSDSVSINGSFQGTGTYRPK